MNQVKISNELVKVPSRVFPAIWGKRRTSSKGCYGPIKETTRREPNKETKKALVPYIATTNNTNTDSPTNSNTHKEQTTINSILPDHQQQTAVAPPRTHR